jgi:flavin reductase (DIM6/NTAB) family NADH-FMN oxidoreductase RutF
MLFHGYAGDTSASLQAMRNGWFHTGDRMYQDADGYFFIHDRKNYAIRRRGENVSSFEVEREVLAYPGVLEAACVAVPSDTPNEHEVKIFLVTQEGTSFAFDGLLRFLYDRLAYFMVPRYYERIDAMPYNTSNRIEKYRLREAGNGDATWDCERFGYRITPDALLTGQPMDVWRPPTGGSGSAGISREVLATSEEGNAMTDSATRRGSSVASETFRRVLGTFPTGVVIIAAACSDGRPVGMTVGSFTSVSLDPPLVAFLPAKTSTSFQAIRESGEFCVNVLAADQVEACRKFATRGAEKFKDVAWMPRPSGAPLLDGAVAYIDCALESVIEAGDHYIVVARVTELDIARDDAPPMVFYRGGYGQFHTPSLSAPAEPDILEALRAVDACRPFMDELARELQIACLAVSMIGDDMAFVGSSGGTRRGELLSRIGQRVPAVPPLGAAFVAWAQDQVQAAWLKRARVRGFPPGGVVDMLGLVRTRGWSITLRSPEVRALEKVLRALDHSALDAETWRRLDEPVSRLTPAIYAPEGLQAQDRYDVATLMAPVFDSSGGVAVALTLLDFEPEMTGSRVLHLADRLSSSARASTETFGGCSPF